MKWTYNLGQRAKFALALILLTILTARLWESSLISTMDASFSSLYKDRLIPAAELFHINDLMYSKRLILETYMSASSNKQSIQRELTRCNTKIDSIIRDYETTYLVDEESRGLSDFKAKMDQYNALEKKLLSNTDTRQDHKEKMGALFQEIRQELRVLTNIQTSIGKQLFLGNENNIGSANIIGYLQIAMVVFIALAVQILLAKSGNMLVPGKPQNFHLN